jgi:protein-S-isoprenylcysteine O-methyltransferase Ste14
VLMVILILTLEEREVSRKFGEDYQAYRQQVPPFNLRPDCLRRLVGLEVAEDH